MTMQTRQVMLAELATFGKGEAWLTFTQAAIALGVDEREISADLALLVGAQRHPSGELLLDASEVVRHAKEGRRPLPGDEATDQADALLEEFRAQGLEFGGLAGAA